MRRTFNTLVGSLLIIAATIGLVVSFAGIIGLGPFYNQLTSGVTHQLALLDQALTATDAGLRTAATSVAQTQSALTSIQGTVDSSASAIDDIVPSIEAMGEVVGDQLPATLTGATGSLASFASTAAVIDQLMSVLGAVPLFSLPDYDPDVSLAESVTGFRESLEGLPEKLTQVQIGLEETAGNLQDIRGEVTAVGGALSGLSGSLDGTVEVLDSYQEVVADLRGQVDAAGGGIEDALRNARVLLVIVLAWLGIASLGLLTQGWELLHRRRFVDLSE
jgi:ABC-type transporter Mla subunit MlaD